MQYGFGVAIAFLVIKELFNISKTLIDKIANNEDSAQDNAYLNIIENNTNSILNSLNSNDAEWKDTVDKIKALYHWHNVTDSEGSKIWYNRARS